MSSLNKFDDSSIFLIQKSEIYEFPAGNIWMTDKTWGATDVSHAVLCLFETNSSKVTQQSRTFSRGDKGCFAIVDSRHFDLLIAVPVKDRLKLFREQRGLLDWALSLSVGMKVRVWIKGSHNQECVEGVVRYAGRLHPEKHGHYFGIELNPEHEGKGTTDGMFRKTKYFDCKDDCGVFVAVSKLEMPVMCVTDGGNGYDPSRSQSNGSVHDKIKLWIDDCRLRINDRIVWMSDEGPEFGIVRWIGVLPEAPLPRDASQLTVGVEFDNPIGSGTGRYKSQTLFQARRNHASLVPILGLLKESDIGGVEYEHNFQNGSHFGESMIAKDAEDTAHATNVLPDVISTSTHTEDLVPRTPDPAPYLARKGKVMPPSVADVESVCGYNRGIQGQSSSKCAMEVVVFTLFAFYADFDEKLFADPDKTLLGSVKSVLVENVVNPLRAANYVSGMQMTRFTDLFSMLTSASLVGCATANVTLTEDPADAVKNVLERLLQVEPLFGLECTSGFVYDVKALATRYPFPRVQHLMERAVLDTPGSRLASVPTSVFIVKVDAARFNRLVPGGRIFPELTLDVNGIMLSYTDPCSVCGNASTVQCGDCFTDECNKKMSDLLALSSYVFCQECFKRKHNPSVLQNHQPLPINIGPAETGAWHGRQPLMKLYAMIALIDDHYVSFFKAGRGESSAWLMYDPRVRSHVVAGGARSVANSPEIKRCSEIEKWLSDVNFARKSDPLPEIIKKLISGLYLCFYRSASFP